MAFIDAPNLLESVIPQRNKANTYYEEVHISGSDLIFYHSASGELTADKISVWATQYGIGIGGTTISSSWASSSLSSSYIPFDGNRAIKRDDPDFVGINVGGTTLVDFVENFFFPFLPATVAIASGGTYYYETGSIENFAINSTITANDETAYETGSITRNGTVWQTVATIPPLSFNYTDTNISTSYSYITYVSTSNVGTIVSNTRQASFIFPYLWGMSTTPGLSGNSLYTEFTKQIQTQGNKTVSMIGNVVYIYFCYPASHDPLISILDPNQFEVISSFEYSASVPVTSSGLTNNWVNTYKVYRTSLVSDPTGNHQFKY